MPVRQYANAPATTLANSCTALATSLTVAATTGLPITYPYTLIIDRGTASEEAVSVTAAAGTTLTVTRGIDSTTAFAHTQGATVVHGITAQDIREANAHVNASTNVHGVTGSVVGTTDTQTLTSKTLALGSNTISGTKAQFNTAVTDGNPVWDNEIGLWQNYTPTIVNATLGTGGSISGRYTVIGKTVHMRASFTFGTGFTIGNGVGLSLPLQADGNVATHLAKIVMTSAGSNTYLALPLLNSTNILAYALGTAGSASAISSSNPFVWKATDFIEYSATYETI